MKILLVNTYDKGGAANSCFRLQKGLIGKGVKTIVLLQSKTRNHSLVEISKPIQIKTSKLTKAGKVIKRVFKKFNLFPKQISHNKTFIGKRSSKLEMFSYPTSNYDITTSSFYKESDIINLHWVANFLDYENFFKKNNKPVVWTLHDMNPFTGGEHYTENFMGIDKEGFPLKRILNDFELAEFKKNILIKKLALNECKHLTIVAPSLWLAQEATKSEIFKNHPIHYIPNGIDIEIFKPRHKNFSRDILGLPQDKKVILFVADSTNTPRKGFDYLIRAFKKINLNTLILCTVGQRNLDLVSAVNIIELGPIYDERLMSIAYSAADVLVIPSLMDNLPNTAIEAIMCGTPVIGFPVGGISEIINNGENGLLTKEISVPSLVEAILKFFDSPEIFDNSKIRENAIEKYDHNIQAERYENLFNTIIGKMH